MSRYFTEDHEWIDVDGDVGTVGISDYAQGQLGDVVFVDVPAEGRELTKGDEAATVESVKAASDVYSPVSGTVLEANAALADGQTTPSAWGPPLWIPYGCMTAGMALLALQLLLQVLGRRRGNAQPAHLAPSPH